MSNGSENIRQELDEAYRQLEQTASRLLLINQAGMLTTSTHDTRVIAQELLTSILDSVFAKLGVVVSYSSGGEVFNVLASQGLEPKHITAFEESETEATALWIASLRKAPVTREDILAAEEWEADLPEPAFAVYLPLIIEEELTGALVAGDKTTGEPFNPGELSFLSSLGHHAAVAINHARLYSQLEKRLRDLDTLLKISQEITSTLDLDRIIRAMVTMASALAELKFCAIGLYRGGAIKVDAVGGEKADKEEKESLLHLMEYVALAEAEVAASAADLPEGEGRDLFRDYFEDSDVRSFWGVPLKDDQGVVGVFCLVRTTRLPSDEEQELFRILTNQATVAIRNAELYNQVPFIGFLEPLLEKRRRLLKMGQNRWKRIAIIVAGALAISLLIRLPHRTGGAASLLPGNRLALRAPITGVVDTVYALEGATVGPGRPVARIRSLETELRKSEVEGELDRARRDEANARTRGDLFTAQLAAGERLTLEQELALLERELDAAMLAPDFPSVVLTPHLEETIGARILSGQTYCEVGTLDRLRVEIALPERNWHRVQVGQTVRLKFYTFAERTFEAEVDALSPTASVTDEGERVLVVTTHLDSPPTGLRPGMSGVGKVYLGRRSLLWHITSPFRRFIAMRWWR
jgi:GAF domain-containing protein/multidrug efflux pump subunit AcrA (membrane-fusion protein)